MPSLVELHLLHLIGLSQISGNSDNVLFLLARPKDGKFGLFHFEGVLLLSHFNLIKQHFGIVKL